MKNQIYYTFLSMGYHEPAPAKVHTQQFIYKKDTHPLFSPLSAQLGLSGHTQLFQNLDGALVEPAPQLCFVGHRDHAQ